MDDFDKFRQLIKNQIQNGKPSYSDAVEIAKACPLLENLNSSNSEKIAINIAFSGRADQLIDIENLQEQQGAYPSEIITQSANPRNDMSAWLDANVSTVYDERKIKDLIELSKTDYEAYHTLEWVCIRWLQRDSVCSVSVHERDPRILSRVNKQSKLIGGYFYPPDIPKSLKEWLIDSLVGKSVKPPKKKNSGFRLTSRNAKISETVDAIAALGFTATRTDYNEENSSCDIVSEACNLLMIPFKESKGEEFNYQRVKDIWKNRNKNIPNYWAE